MLVYGSVGGQAVAGQSQAGTPPTNLRWRVGSSQPRRPTLHFSAHLGCLNAPKC